MAYKSASVEESEEGMNRVGGKIPFLTIPGGTPPKWKTTRLRILPPRDDHPDNTYYFWVATHGKLPGSNRPVLCPQKMYDEFCPACDIGNKLWNEGRKDDARKFFASWRAMTNVIVLNHDGTLPDDGPAVKVWGIPKGVMEDLQSKLKELPKSKRDITDPIAGYDILVRRKGTGLDGGKDTTYEINVAPDATDLSALGDEVIDLLDKMIALDTIYERSTGDNITGLLQPPKTVGRLAAPAADPWDEDEDEDGVPAVDASYTVVDADAEPEKTPAKSRVRTPAPSAKPANENQQAARDRLMAKLGRPVAPVVADDEDDEDEDDEDDEEED